MTKSFIKRPVAVASAVAASFVGLTNVAQAAVIEFTNDQFNFTAGFQFVASGIDFPNFGQTPVAGDQLGNAGDSKGSNNDAIDFIWSPTLPNLDTTVNGTNAVLDSDGGVPAYCTRFNSEAALQDAQIGECGRIFANAGSAGAFEGVDFGTIGFARNFDEVVTEDDSFFINEGFDKPWLQIDSVAASDPTGNSRRFDFMLTEVIQGAGGGDPSLGPITFILGLEGMVRQTNLVTGEVTYGSFTGIQTLQGLRDDGVVASGDPIFNDANFNVTSSSFSLNVTSKVPEPGTVLGLLATAGLGSLVSRKKRSK